MCKTFTGYDREKLRVAKKKFTKPCFGFFLQGSAKETAIANSFVALASMIIFAAGIGEFVGSNRYHAEKNQIKVHIRPVFWVFYYIYWSSEIYLSLLLYKASKRRDQFYCKKWLRIQIICFTIWMILYIAHCTWLHGFNPILQAAFGVISMYKLYTFWVIQSFINEIKNYGSFNELVSRVADADLEEFENGRKPFGPEGPYNRDFEISLDELNSRDFWMEIGSGAFGTVYKAIYTKNGVSIEVAVKMQVSVADIVYFKALLSELKTLIFIGRHENIVNLIGASTANIKSRNLMLVMEFCPYGSLESFLNARRGLFVNLVDFDGNLILNQNISVRQSEFPMLAMLESVTTIDLVRWCLETAQGMEFLSSKGLVHKDLAARNVLLTRDKVAKICDFSLSNRIYAHKKGKAYVRSKEKFLPWRWLAPEIMESISSRDLKFSKETDIWSLGITFWEYFSMGAEPYQHHLEFSKDFVHELTNGMRLERPNHCPASVYEIMCDCWNENPSCRPKYDTIIRRLEIILNEFQSAFEMGNMSTNSTLSNLPTISPSNVHYTTVACFNAQVGSGTRNAVGIGREVKEMSEIVDNDFVKAKHSQPNNNNNPEPSPYVLSLPL